MFVVYLSVLKTVPIQYVSKQATKVQKQLFHCNHFFKYTNYQSVYQYTCGVVCCSILILSNVVMLHSRKCRKPILQGSNNLLSQSATYCEQWILHEHYVQTVLVHFYFHPLCLVLLYFQSSFQPFVDCLSHPDLFHLCLQPQLCLVLIITPLSVQFLCSLSVRLRSLRAPCVSCVAPYVPDICIPVFPVLDLCVPCAPGFCLCIFLYFWILPAWLLKPSSPICDWVLHF